MALQVYHRLEGRNGPRQCQPGRGRVCRSDETSETRTPCGALRGCLLKPARAPAVLFDVDGTLVDSNYLHVYAWQRAFDAEGITVAAWHIHRCIGMDGSKLVRTLSDDAPADVQDRLSDTHSRYYRETASLLAPLSGSQALLLLHDGR